MDESNPKPFVKQTPVGATPDPGGKTDASVALELAFARGSGHISDAAPPPERPERVEHSVMEGLPQAKVERIASIYREVAELQRQLSTAQQRIATEMQARAEDADRVEAMEARLQEQELKSQQDAARAADLEREIAGLRSQLASATAEVAARDAQVDDARRQHRDVTEQFEVQSASLREATTLRETRDAELATRTSERDAEQTAKARLECALEDERKAHGQAIATRDQEHGQAIATRDQEHGQAIATRDQQLTAIAAERDSLKTDLEKARAELETGRARARDLAGHLVKFGQELDGVALATALADRPHRSQPPPLPNRAVAQPVEAVLEVTEAKSTRIRSALLILGGVFLGCAATFGIVKAMSSSSTAADQEVAGAPPPAALAVPVESQPAAQPAVDPMPQPTAEPAAVAAQPTPAADPAAAPKDESAPAVAPAASTTDGVILLPESADGHRVFVDGKKVDVKDSRAVVPCGKRAIQIGSRGTAQTIDVTCGAETAIPADR